nr:VP2 [Bat rotavirus]
MAYRKRGPRAKTKEVEIKEEKIDDKNATIERKEIIVKEDQKNKKEDNEVSDTAEVIQDVEKVVKRDRNEESKQLLEVLKTKENHEKEVQYEILQKTIPTFIPNDQMLKKIEDLKLSPLKDQKKLFRLFEPQQMPIYRQNGERELRNRWYWMLKDDNMPDGDYDVREHFLKLYENVLNIMPDYLILKEMAVENRNSRDAGKVVDAETAKICDRLFEDEETEDMVRRYIAQMRQRVDPEHNRIRYPAILHPIDLEFNQYFIQHQVVEPLNRQVLFDFIPNRLRHDPNYVFNLDNSFLPTARYIPPLLIQDRLNLHDNFGSLWDTLTTANYVLARSVIPDLKELVNTESQIQKMAQDLQLEALSIQSETQFLTGINSQSANDCFKTIIASLLSQRTMSLDFMTSNYMSMVSAMWLLSVVPTSMFLRESVVSCQLAIVNTILYPAFGIARLHYLNGEIRTPFEIAEQQIQNVDVRNWLHFVNRYDLAPVVIDGVLNQTIPDNVRYGRVIQQLMDALTVIARQNFVSYSPDYRRSVQRAIMLLANRTGQLVDLTRLICYNYQTLMACITMNMQRSQTITTEKLQLTSVTSLCMLIGNETVIPEPQTLLHYYKVNVKFHTHYNESMNDAVAIIFASNRFNLYQKKMKSIVENFLTKLQIFDVPKVPDDQLYRLRNRLRQLPIERRRLDVFQIINDNMLAIERASNKIAQGVIIAYEPMPLEHDDLYGFVNITRDINQYQQINLEELMRSGDYSQITNILLNNQPVALVGAIPYVTDTSVISLIAKVDATVFAQIVKQRKVDVIRPILYKINSDSNDFYLVVNYHWQLTSSTKLYKQTPQPFIFRNAMCQLESSLTFQVFTDILAFVDVTTVEPINAISSDGNRIMNEL